MFNLDLKLQSRIKRNPSSKLPRFKTESLFIIIGSSNRETVLRSRGSSRWWTTWLILSLSTERNRITST